MSDKLAIEPTKTALLAMDYQAGIVAGYASNQHDLLGRTARLLAAARKAEMAIIHIVVGFRPGYAEVSPRNLSFSAIRQSGCFLPGDADTAIHRDVAPVEGDIVITKHRVSAFAGTDLEMILRAKGIEHLLLAGIATSGVVLSTTRHAADADYRITIVRDCCSDRDEEVHRVLMDKILPRQASVITLADLLAAFPA